METRLNSALRLTTLFFIKLSITEAINEERWHVSCLILMSFIDETMIRSIISLRNDQLYRVFSCKTQITRRQIIDKKWQFLIIYPGNQRIFYCRLNY